ncbi:MAG: TauD/TfdA family dioxygenase [Polyangiales bacterium]
MLPERPLEGPAAWVGPSLREDEWLHELSADERRELEDAVRALRERSVPPTELTRDAYGFDVLGPALRRWREMLRKGRGFVLVRGLVVDGYSDEDLARVYWLLGLSLGDPVPQNTQGELLCSVRDTGADPDDPNVRLYTTRAEQDFHTDGADIIGLLCLRTAKSGGVSRIVSSVRVFEEVRNKRPDLAPLLFENWHWHLHGQVVVPFPICRYDGTSLATFFIGWYIRRAQGMPDVPPLTDDQRALLELYEATANDPSLYLDMDFRPGDIQLLKNSVILHKRTAYEDYAEPHLRRHLLRSWLAARDFEDGDELLRRGIERG